MASERAQADMQPLSSTATRETTDERNRQLALYHANLIQQRKDTETSILMALEELIEFPTGNDSQASKPAESDVRRFEQLITYFQVSDYDSLIEERNCAGKCGYVFCQNPLRPVVPLDNSSRIVRGARRWGSFKDQELKVVPSARFEMWCCHSCAKAAMYLKVQLSEVPLWERSAATTSRISLLTDDTTVSEFTDHLQRIGSAGKDKIELLDTMEELALERGERSSRASRIVSMPLRERVAYGDVSRPQPPVRTGDDHGREIEGYTPQYLPHHSVHETSTGAVDEDKDWDLA